MSNKLEIESIIVSKLKNIFDPELPINIYDLGLIYKIDVSDTLDIDIDMTLTAPNCPMADDLMSEVYQSLRSIEGVASVNINLVFEPAWSRDMLSEEAMLELGFL